MGNALENMRWKRAYRQYRNRYEIHPSFVFNGPDTLLYGEGRIVLSARSYIGRGSQIQSGKGCKVEIGENCAVSHYLMIYTENMVADEDFTKSHNIERGDVFIGHSCWIGARVYINQGVSIGDNSAVGAHSVVTRDIPPNCIAAGAPAKVVKFKSYLKRGEAEELARKYRDSLSTVLRRDLKE
jgi:maltose O-acetyltransferase